VGEASYVGGLERQEKNPTVDLLDRLAKTLAVHVSEFFTEPATAPPEPLKSGRRPGLQPRGNPAAVQAE
jgi:transcriptional regulator with XRE-family HTH domain